MKELDHDSMGYKNMKNDFYTESEDVKLLPAHKI